MRVNRPRPATPRPPAPVAGPVGLSKWPVPATRTLEGRSGKAAGGLDAGRGAVRDAIVARSDLHQRPAMPTRSPPAPPPLRQVTPNPDSTPGSAPPATSFGGPSASRPAPTGLQPASFHVDGRSAATMSGQARTGRLAALLSGSQAAISGGGRAESFLNPALLGPWRRPVGATRLSSAAPAAQGPPATRPQPPAQFPARPPLGGGVSRACVCGVGEIEKRDFPGRWLISRRLIAS